MRVNLGLIFIRRLLYRKPTPDTPRYGHLFTGLHVLDSRTCSMHKVIVYCQRLRSKSRTGIVKSRTPSAINHVTVKDTRVIGCCISTAGLLRNVIPPGVRQSLRTLKQSNAGITCESAVTWQVMRSHRNRAFISIIPWLN